MPRITQNLINLSRFSGDFIPIAPYAAVYFSKQGITIPQISLLFLIWTLTIILLEIPTGILADRIDRKTVLVFSRLSKLSCFVMWLISPTFAGFLIGFIFWGLASALDSGAFQAFVYENLKSTNQDEKFAKVYGESTAWGFAALFLSALIATVLINWGFTILIFTAIISLFISFAALLLIPTISSPRTSQDIVEPAKNLILNGISFIWTRKFLVRLMIIGIIAGGIKGALEEYNSLFLESKGMALAAIGIGIASLEVMKPLGAVLAGYSKTVQKRQAYLLGIIGALIVLSALVPWYFTVIILSVMTLVDAILWVANDTAIQEVASNDNRATLASLKSFGIELTALCAFGLSSILSRTATLSYIYIFGGIILITTGLIFAYTSHTRQLRNESGLAT
jgi:hypothetical protein